MNTNKTMELGVWLGRSQAFRLVAAHCGAAEAQSLKAIKDNEAYKELGMNWEDFCGKCVGLHRSNVEEIIRRFEEFGPAYFKLAELMRIKPAAYRRIESAVSPAEECLVVAGEKIPFTRDNVQRLVEAVGAMVRRKADEDAGSVDRAAKRLQLAVAQLRGFINKKLDAADRFLLACHVEETVQSLRQAAEILRRQEPLSEVIVEPDPVPEPVE
jgi:hypothetical protein